MNGCIRNYPRMYTGHQVCKLFEQDGVKVTEDLISIINDLLTEYSEDIFMRFGDEKLIQEIYSKAKELYNMKSKSQT
jgi:hypothetical protein